MSNTGTVTETHEGGDSTSMDVSTKQERIDAEELGENLERLSDLARSGRYKAPPVKRGYVPKPGKTEVRPIGMPGFEDKVLQRGVAMVLEPIYEQDFLDCSYGFRPGRSAHQALETIWHNIQRMGGCWLLDVDVRKFFDTLDHQHLREILDRRVRDGVIRRLIGKWLKAGVWESGQISAVSIEFTSRLVVSGTNGCDGGPAAGKERTGNASAFLRRRSFLSPNPESSTPMRGETRA